MKLLAVVILLWIGLGFAVLKPAYGQGLTPADRIIVFAFSSLALPDTPHPPQLLRIWTELCKRFGGPEARLTMEAMRVTFGDSSNVVPAIMGTCIKPDHSADASA